MHLAAKFSSASLIEAFVKAGAKVDSQDDYQQTPLHYAAKFNTSADAIWVLVGSGANVNALDGDRNQTPLHYASEHNTADVISRLIKCGADANVCDADLWTPLHMAARFNCEVVPVLVQHGAKVNTLNSYKHSPLYYVAGGSSKSKKDAVKALVKAGANPHLGKYSPLDDEEVEG